MNEVTESMPREMRTPITEAGSALSCANDFWVELSRDLMTDHPGLDFGEFESPESFFDSNIFGDAWIDPATNGDKSVDEIGLSLDGERDPENAPFALLQVMSTIVAYAVQAMKAEKNNKRDEAWTYASDARYWAGILQAAWGGKKHGTNPAAELARRRHAGNYALVADALKYWREEIDPTISASKAADKLVRVVPLSHKKLAEVIAAEKKKLP
ncbi:hypothetical protein DFO50_103192 [Microvirgula sp. AG722]|uniref:hypothetical protein n=1 Tax=Microvirgula sp. AG722 TaxID=2183901 RepID=UPI000DC32C09|nr:hypothetical protein [Microvirgula sp. AG722]RAS17581.1 hypothetical protein DFO50_103192 [Microvirgula sp. AG722]